MATRRFLVGVVLLVAVGIAVPTAVGATGSTATTDGSATLAATDADNITVSQQVRLVPETPGEVEVTLSASIPDRVEEFAVSPPDRVTVTDADGFTREGDRYEWTEADDPTLTYDLDANVTAVGEGPEPGTGTYLFADAGSWALVRPPQMATNWDYRGDPVGLEWDLAVDGEGASGETMAFLGPHRTHTRQAHGQTFELIVPERTSMRARPNAVLDAFAHASDALRVGDRDERVFGIVAPAGPDWAVRGLQTGDSDLWVHENEPLDVPDNTWLHEYVHTRERLNTTASTKWLTEASATYYAALLALEGDLVDFTAFERHLSRGTDDRYDDVVLTEETTWTRLAEYDKGALVTGEIDRRIRRSTDRVRRFETVFRRLNARDRQFDHRQFLDVIEDVADPDVRSGADRLVSTDDGPGMWSRSEHEAAFDVAPPHLVYRPALDTDDYRVEGAYRNVSADEIPPLVVGERLTVPVVVTNEGGSTGEYDARLVVDGVAVDNASGRIGAGDATTVELSTVFEEPGTYRLEVGENATDVTVSEPATPVVDAIGTNRTTLDGSGAVRLTATVTNGESVPARGEVSFTRDGTVLETRTLTLGPDESREIATTIRLSEPGEYVLGVGDRTTTVTVRPDATPTQTTTATTDGSTADDDTSESDEVATSTDGPGFSALAALLAIAVAILVRP